MDKENEIYETIKAAALSKGLKLNQLAEVMKISRQSLNAVMKKPSYTTLTKIADALKVPIWQLLLSPEEFSAQCKNFFAVVDYDGATHVFRDKESLKTFCKDLK